MRNLWPVTGLVAVLLSGIQLAGMQDAAASDVQKRLVGNWRLVSFDNFDEQGTARPAGYESGRIMYDAAGNMAAQLMRTGRKPLSTPPTETERAAAYTGYVAYFGRYTIDPAQNRITHHVEGATNPNWPKTDLVRHYAFSPDGNRLLLSIKNAQGRTTGTLTWEKMK